MKSIFFKTLALCFVALSLWSCKKDETQTVSIVGAAGTLTASTTTLSLVQSKWCAGRINIKLSTGYVIRLCGAGKLNLTVRVKGH